MSSMTTDQDKTKIFSLFSEKDNPCPCDLVRCGPIEPGGDEGFIPGAVEKQNDGEDAGDSWGHGW